MTDQHDPFATLRRANPFNQERLPDLSGSAHGRALLEEIVTMDTPTVERPRRPLRVRRSRLIRNRRVLIPALVVAVLSAGFTFYALRQVSEPLTIGCYGQADLDADTAVVGADGSSPVAACEELWRQGSFGGGSVPPLTACVLPSGAVGVFPTGGEDTCERLGMAAVDSASYPEEVDEGVGLRTALVDEFVARECVSEQQAMDLVNRELRGRGLEDWTVEVSGSFDIRRPCASLAFEPKSKKVSLVPIPAPL